MRKPSRFWHPARRLLLRAQEQAIALATRRSAPECLDDVRPRLQRYLRAMYGATVSIEALEPPESVHWATKTYRKIVRTREQVPSESDANCIRLPATLPPQLGHIPPLEQYRAIAVQHAERIRRASAVHAQFATTNLERDLFEIAEAATIDAQIAESQPGLRATLDAARATAMAARAKTPSPSALERRVEAMVRSNWSAIEDAASQSDGLAIPTTNDAEANARWARETARSLERVHGENKARIYRRVPEVALWQTTVRSLLTEDQRMAIGSADGLIETNAASSDKVKRGKNHGSKPQQSESEADNEAQSSGDDNDSADNNSDGGDGSDDTTDESAKGQPQPSSSSGNDSSSPDQQPDGSKAQSTDAGAAQAINNASESNKLGGITYQYPEWDFNAQNFNAAGTTVHVMPPETGSANWAKAVLQEHAREVHRARQQFERLRSHRARLRRQVQGDELDLEACVEAMVDRRMHMAPTDRLYRLERPGRRELAITLLIDVSGSTREKVTNEQRVIDIERIAAAVATAAFDALGDDYSILSFSSAGAPNVRVNTVKSFGEKNTSLVLQRIGALEPDGNTRLGSAVRHATAMLNNHPAPHKLLLIISDGKPYDYDFYFIDYAIQDSRQAVMAARQQGIQPFCITVDASEGASYLPEIFGATGYRVVSKPSQLSQALLLAVQRLIGSAN